MRIGQLATRSGVSVRALRYYEEQGLLIAERSPSGQRHYPEEAVEKVLFFQDMYSAGLTSKRIAELMPCFDTGHTDAEQRSMLHAERNRIHERVTQLTAALRRLDSVIAVADTHP
ncbi:MerR family transcriptional regulator [Catenulispora sp. NF23]|uniref:MerR family transcriptional regulator n=1 Tax=Catenulispora pinistramenti TaxID=2705254 RepID=A0ABS5L8N7_9ACTN|nr:MerR family transcriptional regulator [Catenulispora pinistramenti]MBS2540157.1 MerR family transcriptional regulator [Catenulispora pinistramenti]MBS2554701.1 MerR family transcriptional regulator [Catenulispora pinistramenti]